MRTWSRASRRGGSSGSNRAEVRTMRSSTVSDRDAEGCASPAKADWMILVGHYSSPFVRRVAVTLRVLGYAYEHDTRSVFRDFDSMRQTNPIGRIPSLVLDDGEVLIDSAAILDCLDELVGPSRALIPRAGSERRRALRLIALATGAIDKAVTSAYERIIRPEQWRWHDWIARSRRQAEGAIAALATEPWPATTALDQAQITTACMMRYVRLADPGLLPCGRYPTLDALSKRCEDRPEFQATCPPDLPYPRGLPPT